ncbi:MAG: hypothetical protein WDN48_04975 [Pseudolabrys sp.]
MRLVALIPTAFALIAGTAPLAARDALPAGFVYLPWISTPTIGQDIRYAGHNNFVGRPLPGYDAAECVLRSDVAQAPAQSADRPLRAKA